MEPFDSYQHGGYNLVGCGNGSNARRGYGLEFMRLTGQTRCAYCDYDLTVDYLSWLTLTLDHAIPKSLCKSLQIRDEWCEDYSNTVLACAACNGFCNRYRPTFPVALPSTLEAFYALRDQIFDDRKRQITARHEKERQFFAGRPWERSTIGTDL